VVKIKIQKIIGTIAIGCILMLLFSATAFAVEYLSLNEIRGRGIANDLAYAYGYTKGYNEQEDGKASNPLSILTKFRRVSDEDPDYLGAELAYRYKGSYTKGYKEGYTDASDDKERAVSENFLHEYDVIKEGSIQTMSDGTYIYNRWNLDELDTSQGIENFAYDIGYTDASKGNAKTPLKIMYDLAKDESREVRDVYEWIRENRGAFSKKYKEGYEAYLAQSKEGTTETSSRRESSSLASQQSGEDQAKAAYAVGYKFGTADAKAGKASNPQTILNYDWVLNARYNEEAGKYKNTDNNWYKLPEGVTKQDVAEAHADDTEYLKGYREGYTLALRKDDSEEELSEEEYVYKIGFDVGVYDAEKGSASNPYTYTWKTHRYVTKSEEIYYTRMIRYNRAHYIKGYREGYASVGE
jgi:hypothetical protein